MESINQVVPINIFGGIDQRIDPKQSPLGTLRYFQDALIDRPGTIVQNEDMAPISAPPAGVTTNTIDQYCSSTGIISQQLDYQPNATTGEHSLWQWTPQKSSDWSRLASNKKCNIKKSIKFKSGISDVSSSSVNGGIINGFDFVGADESKTTIENVGFRLFNDSSFQNIIVDVFDKNLSHMKTFKCQVSTIPYSADTQIKAARLNQTTYIIIAVDSSGNDVTFWVDTSSQLSSFVTAPVVIGRAFDLVKTSFGYVYCISAAVGNVNICAWSDFASSASPTIASTSFADAAITGIPRAVGGAESGFSDLSVAYGDNFTGTISLRYARIASNLSGFTRAPSTVATMGAGDGIGKICLGSGISSEYGSGFTPAYAARDIISWQPVNLSTNAYGPINYKIATSTTYETIAQSLADPPSDLHGTNGCTMYSRIFKLSNAFSAGRCMQWLKDINNNLILMELRIDAASGVSNAGLRYTRSLYMGNKTVSDSNDNVASMRNFVISGAQMTTSDYIPTFAYPKIGVVQGSKFYSLNQFYGKDDAVIPKLPSRINEDLYIGGGRQNILQYGYINDSCPLGYPFINSLNTAASGTGLTGNSTYAYKLVYKINHPNGDISYGETSPAYSFLATGTPATIVQFNLSSAIPSIGPVLNGGYEIEYYRTTANSTSVFYKTTLDGAGYDRIPDSQLIANQRLYTTGGVVDNFNIGCTKIIHEYNNRLFAVRSEEPSKIYISKFKSEGYKYEFSEFLTKNIDGEITAISSIEDKIFVFTETSCGFFYGQGPNSQGYGDYSDVFWVSRSCGCIPGFIPVVVEDGIMFASSGSIYLLRKDLSVADFIGKQLFEYAGATQWQNGAVDRTKRRAYFSSGSTNILWDWKNGVFSKLTTSIPQLSIPGPSGGVFYCSGGSLFGHYWSSQEIDDNGIMLISTNNINISGTNSRFYAKKLYIMYDLPGPIPSGEPSIEINFGFDGQPSNMSISIDMVTKMYGTNILMVNCPRRRCSTINIDIAESPPTRWKGLKINGISLEAVPVSRGAWVKDGAKA